MWLPCLKHKARRQAISSRCRGTRLSILATKLLMLAADVSISFMAHIT